MRSRILAEFPRVSAGYQWLTTVDVARALSVSARGVRWLAQQGRLPSVTTVSGQRVFRLTDVERFAQDRLRVNLANAHRRPAVSNREPRQLSLFGTARLRLVRGREA